MNTVKHLFLDLEDTIITPVLNGWNNTELINVQKIKSLIADFNPNHVHLFSFAIWNERERSQFELHTRKMIETALGMKLDFIPSVDDHIIPACCRVTNLHPSKVDFQDCSNFWRKQGAFRLFCQDLFHKSWSAWNTETEVFLLDDAVIDEDFSFPSFHLKGTIRNIDQLHL